MAGLARWAAVAHARRGPCALCGLLCGLALLLHTFWTGKECMQRTRRAGCRASHPGGEGGGTPAAWRAPYKHICPSPPFPRRLRHALAAAAEVAQVVCACALFHCLYPAVPGASPLRALACLAAGNGVLALAAQALTSTLPLR